MDDLSKKRIVCTTVLVETSPQALPLGAACIASAVKHNEHIASSFSVELLSFSNEDKSQDVSAIVQKILSGEPSKLAFVCFSVYVWNRTVLERVAQRIKQESPASVLIAGGPEVTAHPFSFENFDYTVAGQGECAVPELIAFLDAKQNDRASMNIAGVYTRRDAALFNEMSPAEQTARLSSLTRAAVPALETIASPYLDGTLDPSKYEGALWELARGCPFKCSYCYESKGEKKIAYFPEARLTKELELFAAKKIAQVFVLDPTYNADKKRAVSMLAQISEKAPGMFFYFEARAEFIDRELARAFTKIPCSLQIGLQSANEEVLSLVHRTMNKKQFVKNIGILNEEGVNFGFDLIYGLPGDSLNGFRQSIDFAVSLYPNNIELFCLSVLPGTDLYERSSELHLSFQSEPPYHVQKTNLFTEQDLHRAATLAQSCSLFYSQGRAVPWFVAVTAPLHIKPSVFFSDFILFCESKGIMLEEACVSLSVKKIEELQIAFIREKYIQKKLDRMVAAAIDCILLNNALSQTTADGTEMTVQLHYHPDDLLSEYASDISFFATNARPFPCRVETFVGKSGADWKICK